MVAQIKTIIVEACNPSCTDLLTLLITDQKLGRSEIYFTGFICHLASVTR